MGEVEELKKQIYDDMRIKEVLEYLGMHGIKSHGDIDYWTCGMPDGDNTSSTTIYNEEKIGVMSYTRIGSTDIIGLVQYIEKTDFKGALNWLYDILKIPQKYYDSIGQYKIKQPAKIFINRLQLKKEQTTERRNITLYEDVVLEKYVSWDYENKDFEDDNILPAVQYRYGLIPYLEEKPVSWNLTYYTGYMVIPIFDEIGNLFGTKLRIDKAFQFSDQKYFQREKYPKGHILYGLYQTKYYIAQQKEVIICESEKGVMQLYSYGYKNAVAVSGCNISDTQVKKIIKLSVDKVVIAFDEDIKEKTLYKEYKKLCDFVEVTCIIDQHHILNEKESPMDNPTKWETLYKECQSIPREFPEFELDIEENGEKYEWENIEDDFVF